MSSKTQPLRGAALKGAALVVTVGITVAIGLYLLTDGKITEDPSKPTPATYAALKQLETSDPQRGARARAGMEYYRHACRLCHNRSGHGGNFTPSLAIEEYAEIAARAEDMAPPEAAPAEDEVEADVSRASIAQRFAARRERRHSGRASSGGSLRDRLRGLVAEQPKT